MDYKSYFLDVMQKKMITFMVSFNQADLVWERQIVVDLILMENAWWIKKPVM